MRPGVEVDAPVAPPGGPRRPLWRAFTAHVAAELGVVRPPPPPTLTVSRYVPLSRRDVLADLCHDPTGTKDVDAFARMGVRLERHRGDEYDRWAARFRDLYAPFAPDGDTVAVRRWSAAERDAMQRTLAAEVDRLLTRANFRPLTQEAITAILSRQSPYSLRIEVDLAEYDLLRVYVRDEIVTRTSVRRADRAFLVKAHFEVKAFARVFVLLKLKPDAERAAEVAAAERLSLRRAARKVARGRRALPEGTDTALIYAKVFRSMAEHDLQILFPLRRVQFRAFDKVKFFATAGGSTVLGIVSTTGKLLAVTNPVTAVGALVAFFGLLGRQVSTFFNQRTRYMMELSQKLFFHNIANNRAALTLLLDRAEEEDVKEDLITMYFCAGESFADGEIAARKRAIDALLAERYRVAVDFEIDDALRRLTADGVVRHEGGRYHVMTFADAAGRYGELLREDDAHAAAVVLHGAEGER